MTILPVSVVYSPIVKRFSLEKNFFFWGGGTWGQKYRYNYYPQNAHNRIIVYVNKLKLAQAPSISSATGMLTNILINP